MHSKQLQGGALWGVTLSAEKAAGDWSAQTPGRVPLTRVREPPCGSLAPKKRLLQKGKHFQENIASNKIIYL